MLFLDSKWISLAIPPLFSYFGVYYEVTSIRTPNSVYDYLLDKIPEKKANKSCRTPSIYKRNFNPAEIIPAIFLILW